MASKDIVVKVRLDRRLAERLAKVARRRGVTQSAVLRDAIGLAERELRREEALGTLVELAKQDAHALAGRRPKPSRFDLG